MSLDETRAYDMTELGKAPLGRVPPAEGPETKVIARTLLVSPTNGPLAGETLHYALDLVNFDYRTWHEYEWGNWVAVDALLYAAFRGVANVSIWVPSHGYIVGNIVVSTETGLAYECLVAHTSNATSIMPDIASGKWQETIIGDSYTKDQADARFINAAGDTMSGALTLFGDPTSPQHAADKQYVDLLDANQKTYIDNKNTTQDAAIAAASGDASNRVLKAGDTMTGTLTINNAAPEIRLHESDQTAPKGMYRIRADADAFTIQQALISNWTGFTNVMSYDGTTKVLTFAKVQVGTTLTLAANPVQPLEAATKQYVDTQVATQKTYIDGLDSAQKTYIDVADATLLTNINTRMRWKGVWAAGTYAANDVVTDTGYLFVAKQTTTQKPYTGKPPAPTQWDILAGGGGGSSVVVSATAPVGPVQGDMWFSTVEPVGLFVWYDDGSGAQWVQTNGGAGTACLPLTGGTLSGDVTIANVRPVLNFTETDQAAPVGMHRMIASSGGIWCQSAATIDWVTATSIWHYNPTANKLYLDAPTVINYANPTLEFDESDLASPLGHYRFWLDGGVFAFQNALTANFATSENIFQFKSKGDGGTGTFNVFPGMSINGTVGASTAPLKLDGSYPAIWFHDSTPSGQADLTLSAGNGWFRFGAADATGVQGEDYFTIAPQNTMVYSYLPMMCDLRTLGGTTNYPFTAMVPAGVNAYVTRVLDENSLERIGLYSSNTNNIVLRNRAGTATTASYLQLNADTSAIIGAAGGFSVDGVTKLATTANIVEIGGASGSQINFKRTSGYNYLVVPDTAVMRVSNVTGTAWASVSSASGWTAGSDAKLKENVEPISYGLDAVLAMKPVEFNWIADGRHDIGFVAQDMIDVVPVIVEDLDDDNEEHTSTLHMRKDAITAVLVKAVQELTARVAELEARL